MKKPKVDSKGFGSVLLNLTREDIEKIVIVAKMKGIEVASFRSLCIIFIRAFVNSTLKKNGDFMEIDGMLIENMNLFNQKKGR